LPENPPYVLEVLFFVNTLSGSTYLMSSTTVAKPLLAAVTSGSASQ
jgi:hypothetical protein